ncbi:zinc ribbon domain-containing protein [bacterium]|nr:zinc ribbon domain-containing protein [bacterium]
MALIDCPECSNKISDKAPSCPHCGVVFEGDENTIKIPRQKIAGNKLDSKTISSELSPPIPPQLPANVRCANCNESLKLDGQEQRWGIYFCPYCKQEVNHLNAQNKESPERTPPLSIKSDKLSSPKKTNSHNISSYLWRIPLFIFIWLVSSFLVGFVWAVFAVYMGAPGSRGNPVFWSMLGMGITFLIWRKSIGKKRH